MLPCGQAKAIHRGMVLLAKKKKKQDVEGFSQEMEKLI